MTKKKVDFMCTAFRDGFQSVYGARVLTKDFLPALEAARDAGIDYFEAGGGARFQSLYFYCNEDAFDMMDAFRDDRRAGRQPADAGPRRERRRARVAIERHHQAACRTVQEARHHDDSQLRRTERRQQPDLQRPVHRRRRPEAPGLRDDDGTAPRLRGSPRRRLLR